MLIAELRGKLPSELQNYEDILTSSVIGLFQYLSTPTYLQSVLEYSINYSGTQLTFSSHIVESDYYFWPKLENSEPDVLLHLRDEEQKEYLICIEAKFWSDKSSSEDQTIDLLNRTNRQGDQLAREIEDIHKNECHRFLNINKDKLDKVILIYLTNHTYLPYKEMLESIQHIRDVNFPSEQLYWLSWRDFHNNINKTKNFKRDKIQSYCSTLKSF